MLSTENDLGLPALNARLANCCCCVPVKASFVRSNPYVNILLNSPEDLLSQLGTGRAVILAARVHCYCISSLDEHR